MPGYKVWTTRAADRDLQETLEYIARDDRTAAEKWAEKISAGIGTLEKFPERAPLIPESSALGGEYRHLVYGNYRIVYRVEGRKVLILRVIHAARLLEMDE